MKLIVGLGNPGREYKDTRHNLGFRVADALVQRWGWEYTGSDFDSIYSGGEVSGEQCIVLKPLTYVNTSGRAVAAAARYFQCEMGDLLIVCDDLNLSLGCLRLRRKGSSGGHNGLQSIIEVIGSEDFARLRIGIGDTAAPGDNDYRDYVLSRFTAEEEQVIGPAVIRASDAVESWLSRGIEHTMSVFNG